ncbi:DUF805 domain-containing protein [Superficieibacter electus]|uniref:DUF805 domain-containing protein n=1 Tax=Superficieibacter electus TaxID=2022662 RepID=A0A2P5GNR9_9ENTR|nr:DUF805 domain-containing protein [Superficieibacter electus]POP44008.1 DUF805 domain-containing protein [Superficieibacter electus]POP48180.1 DUF805 domain-containing protein [Superficieibacter electus]
MNWYISVLKNYVGFSGRARRQEFWMFALISGIISTILNVIQIMMGMEIMWLSFIYSLAILLPNIAVTVRRLHDTDRSGFWALLMLLPVIGWIILFVFTCQNGTSGTNRFGNDPKYSVNK